MLILFDPNTFIKGKNAKTMYNEYLHLFVFMIIHLAIIELSYTT